MKAIAKLRPEPGLDIIEVDPQPMKTGYVRVQLQKASVCGTDYHIYSWDKWSQGRIKPPRIIGHEMAGIITEVGDGVVERKVGDYVATESHIVCGKCYLCQRGQGHVCQNTEILGVDSDGIFRPSVVIPEGNARLTDTKVSPEVASMQDPLGNAVHTVLSGPVKDQSVLITGCGPIGLFCVAICKVLGAREIFAVEVSDYRRNLAGEMGADHLLDPIKDNVKQYLMDKTHCVGVDVALEMSGHPNSLKLGLDVIRPGGRICLLGIYPEGQQAININDVIFKGLVINGIVGRKIWQTWDDMYDLLTNKKLDLSKIVTHSFHFTEFEKAMELISKGQCGKIALDFSE